MLFKSLGESGVGDSEGVTELGFFNLLPFRCFLIKVHYIKRIQFEENAN